MRPRPLVDHDLKNTFYTVFISFVSQLNCKIRVLRLLVVTVRVFCLLKLRKNAPRLIKLGTKNDFFLQRGPVPSSTPHPSQRVQRLAPLLKS